MSAKYAKIIVCLANWRKIHGRAVVGKEIAGGRIGSWIRAVSGRAAGELSQEDRRFENGQEPRPLDIIRIPMIEARPCGYQTEDHLIDDSEYWTKEGEASWDELQRALDSISGPLWDNSSSSYNGLHDRVDEAMANNLGSSLRLVEVKDLKITVAIEGTQVGNAKRKVRGHFTLNGAEYRLAVTDPVLESNYLEGSDGEFEIGPAVLCISFREPYRGYAYKLIASVILKEQRL
jgi:hypothetical protein